MTEFKRNRPTIGILPGYSVLAGKTPEAHPHSPGFEHPITVSMGVSVLSGADVEAEMLVKEADLALYQAKQTGRNRICIFERPTPVEAE